MPNYDYECLKCGKRFEIFQSMKDAKLTDCPEPECDGTVKRLLGAGGGIIFKGSGFYQTDYRSSSYESGAKADKAPGKADGGEKKSGDGKDGVEKEVKKDVLKKDAPPAKGGGDA